MHKIMILGAGIYQLPLIKKAKELGYITLVVSPKGDYPGISLADVWIDLDTRDKEGILEQAMEHNIQAILTTGTDVAVPSIGYVVDHLSLSGTGYLASLCSMNKSLMKKRFSEENVRTADFRVLTSYLSLKEEALKMGYPVMVKAVDSSGSRGITMVKSEGELYGAYNDALEVSQESEVIIEKYLDGYEIGAQAIVVNGEVIEVFLHSDIVTPPPICTPIGHAIPLEVSSQLADKAKNLVRAAVKALGINNTISNVDLMVVGQDIYILELGARMGATCLPENISIYAGFNAYEFIILLALGLEPTLPVTYTKTPNAAVLLKSKGSGILKAVEIPEWVTAHPSLVDLSVDVLLGDEVNAFRIGPDRIGQLIVKADDVKTASDLADSLSNAINFNLH